MAIYAKDYTRSGVFVWSPRNCPVQGLIVGDYAQQFSLAQPAVCPKLDFIPLEGLYSQPYLFAPSVSTSADFKLNDVAWTMIGNSEDRPYGVCIGGCENGTIVVFDAAKLVNESRVDELMSRRDHQGHVLSVDVSRDNCWALSGGGNGQVLLWELANLSHPFSPGQPSFPDQVKCVKWSPVMDQIAASLTSHRCSLWDMRRPGTPFMEIAEVGGGCDWSELTWSSIDDSALLTASQADGMPVILKWDLRYPTAPLKEIRIHSKGVTAIHLNEADPRLLLSASHDGSMLISNPETSEVLGQIPVRNDWVRRVRWNAARPQLVAIQYFQNALQVSSLHPFSAMEETVSSPSEGSVSTIPVEMAVVPQWESAGNCSVSWAFGRRHVSHSRRRDPATGAFIYEVEIRRVDGHSALYESAMSLQNAVDGHNMAAYAEDKANAAEGEAQQLVWTLLSASLASHSRNDSIHILGFQDTNTRKESTTMDVLSNGISGMSGSGSSASPSPVHALSLLPPIDFSHIDATTWSHLDALISGDLSSVVRDLISSGDLFSAFLLSKEDKGLHEEVLTAYHSQHLAASHRLLSYVACGGLSSLSSCFPSHEWRRLLGLTLRFDPHPTHRLSTISHQMSKKSESAEEVYRSCIPAVLAGDVGMLLAANKSLPAEERVRQVIVMRGGKGVRESDDGIREWEPLIYSHAAHLANHGFLDLAWRLVNNEKPRSQPLAELRLSLWESCGGQGRTQRPQPPNPLAAEQSELAAAICGGSRASAPCSYYQPSVAAASPRRPSAASAYSPHSPSAYSPPSPSAYPPYSSQPPAPVHPYPHEQSAYSHSQQAVPISPAPSASSGHGWNDPPPLPAKKTEARVTSLAQISWVPSVPTPVGVGGVACLPFSQMLHSQSPFSHSFTAPSQRSPLSYQLLPADESLLQKLRQLTAAVAAASRTPQSAAKAAEAMERLNHELLPRLACNKLTPRTRGMLENAVEYAFRGQGEAAKNAAGSLVQGGADFVEVSAFLPALKSLLSLANAALTR